MKKAELLTIIDTMNDNQMMTLVEVLDSGEKNLRDMRCSNYELWCIIDSMFNDELHGHVVDKIETTIKTYIIKEREA